MLGIILVATGLILLDYVARCEAKSSNIKWYIGLSVYISAICFLVALILIFDSMNLTGKLYLYTFIIIAIAFCIVVYKWYLRRIRQEKLLLYIEELQEREESHREIDIR